MKAHVLLVLATIVWGATFVLIKDALADISPLYFNAVRMTLASVALLLIFRRDMVELIFSGHARRGPLIAGSLVGVLLWLGLETQTSGLRLTTPSKSAFITGVSVVLVPVLLAFVSAFRALRGGSGREDGIVNLWTALGVGGAFIGLYLLTVPATRGAGFDFADLNRGDLLTLGCAVAFAMQIIIMGRATSRYRFQHIAALEATVCAILMWLSLPLLEGIQVVWSGTVIWAILITGLLGTAGAFTVQAWAQQFTPPTHTALIFSLEPVFAWITSYLVLQERLGSRATVGALLILAGVLTSELKGTASQVQRPQAELAD